MTVRCDSPDLEFRIGTVMMLLALTTTTAGALLPLEALDDASADALGRPPCGVGAPATAGSVPGVTGVGDRIARGYPASGVALLSNVDLGSFGELPASAGNDVWGYTSPSGREYALMGLNNRTAFVDITDPRNPVVVDVLEHPNTAWSDIRTYQHYAYVVTDQTAWGLQIVDLAEIDDGIVRYVDTYTGDSGLRFTTAHNIAVNEESGFLYISGAQDNGYRDLGILDLSDPEVPVYAGNWVGRAIHDCQVVTYHGGEYDGREIAFLAGEEGGLWILDVTDKAAIEILTLGATYPGLTYCHQTWLSEDRRHVFVNDELDEPYAGMPGARTFVFNVEDLENPVYVRYWTNDVTARDHNCMVRGDFLFEANYQSGLRVIDVSDVDRMAEVGFFDTHPVGQGYSFAGAWGVFTDYPSGVVVVSDMNEGLFVLDPLVAQVPFFARDEQVALEADGPSRVPSWGDIDGDGDPDLYVPREGAANLLYRNDDATFVEIGAETPVADEGPSRSALFADVDGDEHLDLYVVESGSANRLFINDGTGAFTDATVAPLDHSGAGRAAYAVDIDADRDVDIYLTNFGQANRLYRNDGGGVWVEISAELGLDDDGRSSGAAFADVDLDGDLDLAVANFDDGERLFVNEGGVFTAVQLTPETGNGRSIGATFGDYDGDGDPDLFVTRLDVADALYRNDDGELIDVAPDSPLGEPRGSLDAAWLDYDSDGRLDLVLTDDVTGVRLIRNDALDGFIDVTGLNFEGMTTALSLAVADVDADGRPDVFVADDGGSNRLFKSQAPLRRWLGVTLIAPDDPSGGVGARVEVQVEGSVQSRVVGSGSGLGGHDPSAVRFGLDQASLVDRVSVRWPDGTGTDLTDVASDQVLNVTRFDGTPTEPETPPATSVPLAHALYPSTPNPATSGTFISYAIAHRARVRVTIYDTGGRRVRSLDDAVRDAGRYTVRWDGNDDLARPVAPGTYFYRLDAGGVSQSRRVVLLR